MKFGLYSLILMFLLSSVVVVEPVETDGPPRELTNQQYLYDVLRHLYRWYLDETDVYKGTRDKEQFTFWVRALHPKLDPGDESLLGEIALPVLGIKVKVKKAHYTIEELDTVVKNDTFKIINVSREALPAERPEDFEEVVADKTDMRAYLFHTRTMANFPDDQLLLRLRIKNVPGTLGKVTTAIGEAGGDIGSIDITEATNSTIVRNFRVYCRNEDEARTIVDHVAELQDVEIDLASDRTFQLHRRGKIEVQNKVHIRTDAELAQ